MAHGGNDALRRPQAWICATTIRHPAESHQFSEFLSDLLLLDQSFEKPPEYFRLALGNGETFCDLRLADPAFLMEPKSWSSSAER